jgi:hypothetical protein
MTPEPASELPARPFAGPEAYDYADKAVFTGREEESEKLLRLVTIYRGVLLYGPAGVGKTSLLYAGFLPKAVLDGYMVARVELGSDAGAELRLERIPVKHGAGPPYLPWPFSNDPAEPPSRVFSPAELKRALEGRREAGHPLLIFDDFESYTTLSPAAQQTVGDLVIRASSDHNLRVKMLFSFREEHLGQMQKLFVRAPDLMDVTFRLPPLKADELERILREPFRRFPGHFSKQIPDEVVEQLTTAVKATTENGELNLAGVGVAAQRLIESPNPEALLDTGIHEIVTGKTGMFAAMPQPAAPPAAAPSRAAGPALSPPKSRSVLLWIVIGGAAALLLAVAGVLWLPREAKQASRPPGQPTEDLQWEQVAKAREAELAEFKERLRQMEAKAWKVEPPKGEPIPVKATQGLKAEITAAPCSDPEAFRIRSNWVRSFRMGGIPVQFVVEEIGRNRIAGYVTAATRPWWQDGWLGRPSGIPRQMSPVTENGALRPGMFARCSAVVGQSCEARLANGWSLRFKLRKVAGDEAVMEACAAE